ncbi:mitogen-activated protein kinase kinase kinase NPK1-like [Setaria viridis]|uniref:mitogen-activated protein kinase kinase kinase NPK1-like n=1 Tax=Setaria viridis TaxID=4556 RepID=UPI001493C8C5|nr:mitogen-activated protein kinase kinase kinase NPK1-like [Setaria viridis]
MAMVCLESEIRILKWLSSPYVVAYLGDGKTAISTVCGLRRVATALWYLHGKAGVVHKNVKGQNVLLGCCDTKGYGVKLADFGATRLVSEMAPRGLTQEFSKFQSPSQASSSPNTNYLEL